MKNQIEFCKGKLEPKIYVACLAAYNNGYLHGAWIDAHQDVDSLYAEIKKMLSKSPIANAEEFAIHDYEDFGVVIINEYDSMDTVSAIADFVVEQGELGAAVLAHTNGDMREAQCLLDDCYHGEYESEEEFAESFAQDTMEIPDNLAYYINYEKMARDLFIDDFFSIAVHGKMHVFNYF